ncbi:MAG: hypothetical protein RSC29_06385, partial [Oscillospiraceae bacterium]
SGTPADITYRWLISDKEDGYYTRISNARDYTLGMETGGNFIKFAAVKPNGDYTTTAPRKIHKNWNTGIGEMPDGEGHVIPYKNEFTPKEFVFGIDGQDFILLESTESDESRFLVMSKASIGKRNINKGGQLLGDLLAWLNNKNSINRTYHGSTSTDATDDYTTTGYIGNAGFTQLPQKILDNINKTNKWKQEIKMWEADSEMVYEAGLAIPSVTELIRYSEKIGLCDTGANWWTRTPFAKSKASGELMMRVLGTKAEMGNVKNAMGNTDNLDIRPMFYLKKDFFKTVKLDISKTGANVISSIKQNYTKSELSGIYTEDELINGFGYKSGVSVSNVSFSDMNRNNVESIEGLSEFNVSGDLVALDENASGDFIVAVYDKNNMLKVNEIQKFLFSPGEASKNINIKMTVLNPSIGDYAKAMVWDTNMNPLCTPYETKTITAKLNGIYETHQNIKIDYPKITGANTIFKWYVSDVKNGTYNEVLGSSLDSFYIKEEYANKWIKAEVTQNSIKCETEPRQVG